MPLILKNERRAQEHRQARAVHGAHAVAERGRHEHRRVGAEGKALRELPIERSQRVFAVTHHFRQPGCAGGEHQVCGGLRYIDAGFRGACRRDSPRAADIQGPAFGQTDNDTGGPRGGLPHCIGRRGLPVSTDGDGQRRFGQFEDVPQVAGGSGDRGRAGTWPARSTARNMTSQAGSLGRSSTTTRLPGPVMLRISAAASPAALHSSARDSVTSPLTRAS